MKIEFNQFNGIIPRFGNEAPRKLPADAAQIAENVDLLTSALIPIKDTSLETNLPDANRISAFLYNDKFLSFLTDVDFIRSPVTNEIFNRVYFTGDGVPKLRATISGVETEFNLGVPAPVAKISVAVSDISATTWTREWGWQYENFATGEVFEEGVLREGNFTDTLDAVALGNPSGTIARFTSTSAAHGFKIGDTVIIAGLIAPIDVYNGTHTVVAVPSADEFDIDPGFAFVGGTPAGGEDLLGQVDEVTPGSSYRLHTRPAKSVGTPLSAIFVMFFDGFDANGSFLGRLYPGLSAFSVNSDFILDGAESTALEINLPLLTPEVTFDITYITTRATDFEVDRAYVYTFVTILGEEGPPSPASNIATVSPVQKTDLTAFDPTVPGQGSTINVQFINIYRTASSEAGTFFNFVAQVPFPTVTFEDLLTDAELGSAITSADFFPPPSDMIGLVLLPGGYAAGFRPGTNTVLFSQPFQPHAWPPGFARAVDFEIVGYGVNNSGLVVTTTGNPTLLVGSEPSLISETKIALPQSCTSKRSIAVTGDSSQNAVLYASPDGLVVVEGSRARLFTENFYRPQDWQLINPSTMVSEVHNGKYFGFTDNFGLIVDFGDQGTILTSTDERAAGLTVDLERDRLYLIQGSELNSWRTGDKNKQATWKSRENVFSRRTSFSAYRVRADAYTATSPRLLLYGNKVLVLDIVVPDDKAHRLKTLRDETIWEIELVTTETVQEALISTSMQDL